MQKGKITGQARTGKASIFWEFHIEFPTKTYWPYSHLFTRENLYYSEELWDRGSILFPIKEKEFDNTEIFLERDDIVVCCGVRGSFSGQEKKFIEFVNLETWSKKRLYAEEVSLIYNTQETLIVCFQEKNIWKKQEYALKDFSLISETEEHFSAFFKLLYNHDTKDFHRLIYIGNSYFHEVKIQKTSTEILEPLYFTKHKFELTCENQEGKKVYIDVWKSSLTWEL